MFSNTQKRNILWKHLKMSEWKWSLEIQRWMIYTIDYVYLTPEFRGLTRSNNAAFLLYNACSIYKYIILSFSLYS